MPVNFDPTTGTYPVFIKNKPTGITGFKLDIKNNAAALTGNNIIAETGDNYAIDVYFAKVDLKTTSTGAKSSAFPATLTAGNLKVGLAATATTTAGALVFKSTLTLPSTNCNSYVWLCVCVKAGPAARYVDSVTTNNFECKDATNKISCDPGK
jgi:hypothetical protein